MCTLYLGSPSIVETRVATVPALQASQVRVDQIGLKQPTNQPLWPKLKNINIDLEICKR